MIEYTNSIVIFVNRRIEINTHGIIHIISSKVDSTEPIYCIQQKSAKILSFI